MSAFQNVTMLEINEILFSAQVRIFLTCKDEDVRLEENDVMALDAMVVNTPNECDRLGRAVKVIKGIDQNGGSFVATHGQNNAECWEGHWLLLRAA